MTTFVVNTNVVELQGLKNAILDAFIDDADVTLTVCGLASDGVSPGDPVTGQTWPATMSYVVASDGIYRAILKDTAELTAGTKYLAVIDADGGPDLIGHWEFPFVPATRTKK